jgi:hypothetical protein
MGLAYIYCDFRDQNQQTTKNIIGAILKQLLRQLPCIPEEIAAIWQKHHNGKEPLELVTMLEALRNTCKSFNRTFICVDALDECQDADRLLESLQSAPFLRLFATGRKHVQPIIDRCVRHTHTIHIEANESDIRILIKQKINQDRKRDPELITDRLEQDIIEKISALSKGMFATLNVQKCLHFVDYMTDFSYRCYTSATFLKHEPNANAEKP